MPLLLMRPAQSPAWTANEVLQVMIYNLRFLSKEESVMLSEVFDALTSLAIPIRREMRLGAPLISPPAKVKSPGLNTILF